MSCWKTIKTRNYFKLRNNNVKTGPRTKRSSSLKPFIPKQIYYNSKNRGYIFKALKITKYIKLFDDMRKSLLKLNQDTISNIFHIVIHIQRQRDSKHKNLEIPFLLSY